MTRFLPSRPSLEFLKKRAKEICKSRDPDDPMALSVLRAVPQFRRLSDEQLRALDVPLAQCQHALARFFGYYSWDSLKRFVEEPCSLGSDCPTDLRQFLDSDGRIEQWPAKRSKQLQFIALLATKFEADRIYRESEVNDLLRRFHTFGDPALLRRELICYHYLERLPDCSQYWKGPGPTSAL